MPRVGDGIVLIDARGEVEFATPNATNALHRLGIYASVEGHTLREMGLRVRVVERCLEYGIPAHGGDRPGSRRGDPLSLRTLVEHGIVTGVVLFLRDVSDLRQLNRLVLEQGSGGARGPPPGEEQPPDDFFLLRLQAAQ